MRTDSACGFGKSIQAHLRGGILCRHLFVGDFRKVLAENRCTQKVINLAQIGLDMVGLVDGPEQFCIARSEECGDL